MMLELLFSAAGVEHGMVKVTMSMQHGVRTAGAEAGGTRGHAIASGLKFEGAWISISWRRGM